ncbi:MAG: hypothetical protein IH921_02015 [Gemmatimonadetes bacterium]|nr:hypothetical protein [Gemmatimonadota bacterium]
MSFRTYHEVAGTDRSDLMSQVLAQRDLVAKRLESVRRVVAVMSGKGGVGKSYVTAAVASAAARGLAGGGGGGGGGQRRFQSGAGGGFNKNWDGSWTVATSLDAEGWYAEFRIPFNTLRYGTDGSSWGFNVSRRIRRLNEESFWSPVPREFNLYRLNYAGDLEGLAPPFRRLATVTPYALGSTARNYEEGETAFDEQAEFGGEAKIQVTQGLTFDLTVNTDFAQVEVDNQQVNLTRFSLLFPEKRPFFLRTRASSRWVRGVRISSSAETSGSPTVCRSRSKAEDVCPVRPPASTSVFSTSRPMASPAFSRKMPTRSLVSPGSYPTARGLGCCSSIEAASPMVITTGLTPRMRGWRSVRR